MEIILWITGVISAVVIWIFISDIYNKAQRTDYLRSQLDKSNDSIKIFKARIEELENERKLLQLNITKIASINDGLRCDIKNDEQSAASTIATLEDKLNEEFRRIEKLKVDDLAAYSKLKNERDILKEKNDALESKLEYERESMDAIAKEKTKGFPWIAKAYEEFWRLQDGKIADEWQYKKRPALKAADAVRQAQNERRTAEKALSLSNHLMDYCRFLAPWLDDYIGIETEELEILTSSIHDSWSKTEDVFNDEVRKKSGPKFDSLPQCEKLQKKLDYYWNRTNKTDWQIGKDYERYVGYLYEQDGWKVQYHGMKGFEDLGRDLICKKNGITEIIQCKRWAQGKEIHEKHIYYLFGTAIEFYLSSIAADDSVVEFDLHKFKKLIKPILISTVDISHQAKQVAHILGVEVKKYQFKDFPSIKCNISQVDGSRIYHLPFDQQYDKTRIEEEKLECRVSTIKEAEKLGFRHAFRWHGDLKEG